MKDALYNYSAIYCPFGLMNKLIQIQKDGIGREITGYLFGFVLVRNKYLRTVFIGQRFQIEIVKSSSPNTEIFAYLDVKYHSKSKTGLPKYAIKRSVLH